MKALNSNKATVALTWSRQTQKQNCASVKQFTLLLPFSQTVLRTCSKVSNIQERWPTGAGYFGSSYCSAVGPRHVSGTLPMALLYTLSASQILALLAFLHYIQAFYPRKNDNCQISPQFLVYPRFALCGELLACFPWSIPQAVKLSLPFSKLSLDVAIPHHHEGSPIVWVLPIDHGISIYWTQRFDGGL